jgi:adenylate cyclase
MKQSQPFIDLTRQHEAFLARFRAQEWNMAETLSYECEKMNGAQLNRLYELYRERIAYFRTTPPPPNWDGTAEALSK